MMCRAQGKRQPVPHFAEQLAAVAIGLMPGRAFHLDPGRRSAGAVDAGPVLGDHALQPAARIPSSLSPSSNVSECRRRPIAARSTRCPRRRLRSSRWIARRSWPLMLHEVERPQHGLQYRVSGCTCWSLEGGQERELEAQLQGANETFRPELNAGLASPIEAGFDEPRAEPLAFRSRHPWSTQLPPDEPCLAGFGQLPSNANLAGAIGQGAILGGVGGKLMQTQRQR